MSTVCLANIWSILLISCHCSFCFMCCCCLLTFLISLKMSLFQSIAADAWQIFLAFVKLEDCHNLFYVGTFNCKVDAELGWNLARRHNIAIYWKNRHLKGWYDILNHIEAALIFTACTHKGVARESWLGGWLHA